MLTLDKNGIVQNPQVKLEHNLFPYRGTTSAISPKIEGGAFPKQGDMPIIHGIIVHQTNTPLAGPVFNSYGNDKKPDGTKFRPDGAHFLIDKDGTIYQTASLFRKTQHVGALKARCLLKAVCQPAELAAGLETWNTKAWIGGGRMKSHQNEKVKTYPDRFPSNDDSIGIELVGESFVTGPKGTKIDFVDLTDKQRESLKWLLRELAETLKVPLTEIFRHPVVAFKEPAEARSAQGTIDELLKEAEKAKQ